MSRENVVQRFAVFVGLLSCIHSLPHDICFEQFDARDCKQPAKQVFYFYKPGSRCEIATWRGCPTRNKFDNEFECSHRCVGKLWTGSGEVQDKEREIIIIDTCKETLNTTDCGKHQEVYTFDDGICLKKVWKGCDTHNKFGDEAACTKACVSENDWKLELNALEIADVEEIDKLLHHVLEKERKLMKLLYYQEEIKPETTALEGESEPANVTEPELESEEKPKTEAEPEAAAKPEVDTEPEAEAEPESEAEPEAEAEAEPEVEAEPGAEAEPEAQTEVLPATETTPETTAESESEEGTWTNRPEVVGSLEEVITT